jgi:hypothetical protein
MGFVNMSCILNKKEFPQAFDRSALLMSYCETSSDLDQCIIELFENYKEVNLSIQNDEYFKPNYKYKKS